MKVLIGKIFCCVNDRNRKIVSVEEQDAKKLVLFEPKFSEQGRQHQKGAKRRKNIFSNIKS